MPYSPKRSRRPKKIHKNLKNSQKTFTNENKSSMSRKEPQKSDKKQ